MCTSRQPIVNRVVARKATDWSKFYKRRETGNSIGLYLVSECTRMLSVTRVYVACTGTSVSYARGCGFEYHFVQVI